TYNCPYCQVRPLETVSKAPFVRGYVLAYQLGYQKLVGCVRCVRIRILRQAAYSLLLGWFSITALIINPFLIIWNLLQAPFIKPRPKRVEKALKRMGLPINPQKANLTDAGYALAASMITADGKIESNELMIAEVQGQDVFGEFDKAEFRRLVSDYKELPPAVDMAALFSDLLTADEKAKIYRYLEAIATADGDFAKVERELLNEIGLKMGYLKEEDIED
ncbi:MAG: tellurite resistance TerB family protein, partial [Bacteroidota bacterium]